MIIEMVLFARPDAVRRQWFTDARDNGRRMEVSWHPDETLVIVSLWHGSVCRATFRMPVEQAPALVHTLTDALGDAVQSDPPSHPAGKESSLFRQGRDRLRRRVAEIIRLEDRPEPH
jgi:hypothetical protein